LIRPCPTIKLIAVHSMKDVPTNYHPGIIQSAVLPGACE
jgi:porphobilinogen deaminase